VAAMQHSGGGKNDIPNRHKPNFFICNLTPPPGESQALITFMDRLLVRISSNMFCHQYNASQGQVNTGHDWLMGENERQNFSNTIKVPLHIQLETSKLGISRNMSCAIRFNCQQ
jgi:hypothetical protein